MLQRRHRSSLFLLELILVIFFFSLASAVCIQLFVKAHVIGTETEDLNHAIPLAESAAEAFHSVAGDLEQLTELFPKGYVNAAGDSFQIFYDENWHPVEAGEGVYTLAIVPADPPAETAAMGRSVEQESSLVRAAVKISKKDSVIYELAAAVQIPRTVPKF